MKILFIFHDSEYTGATIAIYRNILWLKNNGVDVHILITKPGDFVSQLSLLGKPFYWNKREVLPIKTDILNRIKRRLFKIFYKPKEYKDILLEQLRLENFDLIYANTICSSIYINELKVLNKPIVWHIHELELAINIIGTYHLEAYKFVYRVIANSEHTKQNLILKHGFSEDKIIVHYPGINITDLFKKSNENLNIFKTLNIPNNSFIIGTSGSVINRKGCETFIILIKIFEILYPKNNLFFVWIGHNYHKHELEHDIMLSEIKHKVIFAGNVENPICYYKNFDIFISLSKEESFGLAAIEAAFFEKPIVFFDKTGGLSEIFSNKTGGEIPYLDLIALANKLMQLYKNTDLRNALGNEAHNIALKYDENILMNQLLSNLIELKSNLAN